MHDHAAAPRQPAGLNAHRRTNRLGGDFELFTFFCTQTYYELAPKGLKMLM
jgi:hypothetical protein